MLCADWIYDIAVTKIICQVSPIFLDLSDNYDNNLQLFGEGYGMIYLHSVNETPDRECEMEKIILNTAFNLTVFRPSYRYTEFMFMKRLSGYWNRDGFFSCPLLTAVYGMSKGSNTWLVLNRKPLVHICNNMLRL